MTTRGKSEEMDGV